MPQRALDLLQLRRSPRVWSVEAMPLLPRVRTADAMDEILGHVGQIVVDHVRDVIDVNAASGYVGGYQDAIASLLEPGEGRVALRLRAVAVNHGGGESVAAQRLGQFVGSALGAREDQAAAGFLGEQPRAERPTCLRRNLEGLEATVSAGLSVDPSEMRTGVFM